MPIHHIHLTSPVQSTFRTEQIAGLFDLPLDDLAERRLGHSLTAELPGLDEPWTIGAIVGPSGSGKTTLARAAYGEAIYQPQPWPEDEAVIDALDDAVRNSELGARNKSLTDQLPVPSSAFRAGSPPNLKHLLRVLTAVGLSSPPSWLKPYRVLSTGERFRADLARAILVHTLAPSHSRTEYEGVRVMECERRLLAIDEFTSTLDRTIACTASAALAKFLRSSASNPKSQIQNPKFVCLSCHTDFLPWLAPDWILDLGAHPPRLARHSLPHPSLALRIERVPQKLWAKFAPHHYLSGGLSRAATCYAAFASAKVSGSKFQVSDSRDKTTWNLELETWNSAQPIAFCAVVAALGWKRTKRITRLVVLPEFQGLGIGPRLAEAVAGIEAAKGNRVTITASHPAILAWCRRSPQWKYLGLKKTGSTRQQFAGRPIRCSSGRAVASFEYIPVQ